jgi:PX domain/Variant SH3 domain/SH3 domain
MGFFFCDEKKNSLHFIFFRSSLPMSENFDLSVSIASTELKHGKSAKYTMYKVNVTLTDAQGPVSWTLARRYSQFYNLHYELVRKFRPLLTQAGAQFPSKKFFGRFDSSFVDRRRVQLELYVQTIVRVPQIRDGKDVRLFLEVEQSIADLRSSMDAKQQEQQAQNRLAHQQQQLQEQMHQQQADQQQQPQQVEQQQQYGSGHMWGGGQGIGGGNSIVDADLAAWAAAPASSSAAVFVPNSHNSTSAGASGRDNNMSSAANSNVHTMSGYEITSDEDRQLAVVLYDFEPRNEMEIKLCKGDVVVLLKKNVKWSKGQINGEIGYFPTDFVQEIAAVGDAALSPRTQARLPPQPPQVPNPKQPGRLGADVTQQRINLAKRKSLALTLRSRVDPDKLAALVQGDSDNPDLDNITFDDLALLDDEPVMYARALFDFRGQGELELSFDKDDIVSVLKTDDESGWYDGEIDGRFGTFPAVYVELFSLGDTDAAASAAAPPVVDRSRQQQAEQREREQTEREQTEREELERQNQQEREDMERKLEALAVEQEKEEAERKQREQAEQANNNSRLTKVARDPPQLKRSGTNDLIDKLAGILDSDSDDSDDEISSHPERPLSPSSRALSPPSRPGRALSPPSRPGRALSPPSRPGRALSPPSQPGRALSPPSRPGRALSPPSQPGRALSPPSRPGRALSPQPRGERALSPPARAEAPPVRGTPMAGRGVGPRGGRGSVLPPGRGGRGGPPGARARGGRGGMVPPGRGGRGMRGRGIRGGMMRGGRGIRGGRGMRGRGMRGRGRGGAPPAGNTVVTRADPPPAQQTGNGSSLQCTQCPCTSFIAGPPAGKLCRSCSHFLQLHEEKKEPQRRNMIQEVYGNKQIY